MLIVSYSERGGGDHFFHALFPPLIRSPAAPRPVFITGVNFIGRPLLSCGRGERTAEGTGERTAEGFGPGHGGDIDCQIASSVATAG